MPSPTRQSRWISKVSSALRRRDAPALREHEKERLDNPLGLELVPYGVLGVAARQANAWGVATALDGSLPLPDLDALVDSLVHASYGTAWSSAGADTRQEIWGLLASHLPRPTRDRAWSSWLQYLGNTGARDFIAPFMAMGVSVHAPIPMESEKFWMNTGVWAHFSLDKPAVWTPLAAAFHCQDAGRVLELLDAGADPFSRNPETLLPDWSLAGALGLEGGRVPGFAFDLDGPDWELVRSRVREMALARRLPGAQGPSPRPGRL